MTDRSLNLATLVLDRAASHPQRPAIIEGRVSRSYGEFAVAVDRAARALVSEGLGPGDRIGLEVPQFFAHWVMIMAVVRIGGVSASLIGPAGLTRAGFSGFDAILSIDPRSALREAPGRFIAIGDDWLRRTESASVEPLPDADAAAASLGRFVYTSGTTGRTKGVIHAAASAAQSVAHWMEVYYEDTKFLQGGGIEGTMHHQIAIWARGGAIISNHDLRDDKTALAAAAETATFILAGPASLASIMDSKQGLFDGREGRIVRSGSAPVSAQLRDDVLARLAGTMFLGYGSREAGTMAGGPAELLDRHPGAVGYPPLGGAIEVVDAQDHPLGPKEHGIVRVRNQTMARSYINNPEATAEFFRGGWFYPGDIGYLEDDGCLVVLGRSNDVVNIGGVKFSPTVVEHAVRALAGIDEVCALAVPDVKGINRMVLLLQSAADADRPALYAAIVESLAEMEIANFIAKWVDEIPRTERGKISRAQLIDQLRAGRWA